MIKIKYVYKKREKNENIMCKLTLKEHLFHIIFIIHVNIKKKIFLCYLHLKIFSNIIIFNHILYIYISIRRKLENDILMKL